MPSLSRGSEKVLFHNYQPHYRTRIVTEGVDMVTGKAPYPLHLGDSCDSYIISQPISNTFRKTTDIHSKLCITEMGTADEY
jgi:hypothetical protein